MRTTVQKDTGQSVAASSALFEKRLLAGLGFMAMLTLGLINFIPQAKAQVGSGYNSQNYQQGSVVMYSECGFRGTAQTVGIGEHSKIVNLRFPNDQMSSISIPAGYEVTIYENDKFRGAFARLNQDIACFDQSWNDSVSSIKVAANRNAYNSGFPPRITNQPAINAANLALVNFATSSLRRINDRTWALSSSSQFNGQTNYNVINQDGVSIDMQSSISSERLRIDLPANRVTYYSANGLAQDYPILQKQAGSNFANNSGSQPNTSIRGRCFNYRAYARGGNAGLRFDGKDMHDRFNDETKTGQICHSGSLRMEMLKTHPNTEVVVEIQGKRFVFGKNEKEDQLRNNWYRKFITLNVGG